MSNRLATEPSPYLRLHAENPVDWYPWGEEAFAEAARRQVPVFVSVGYATCHWCHVMARESFADAALAETLNKRFVSIKVDREEYPEVDAALLEAASAFTRQLGWPLSVFLTPTGGAFYAGTYFPPIPVSGSPSFRQVLAAVDEAWTQRRDAVDETAASVRDALAAVAAAGPGREEVDPDAAVGLLEEAEDERYGGFGAGAKFPVAPVLAFLLTRAGQPDETGRRAGTLAQRTLHRMALSPLRDPVEGGFFRYATQRNWSEPHYERMLSDNAQLLDAYARAWALDAREQTARTAAGIADYLLRVLRLPDGLFAAGQDSESTIDGARREGEYFRRDAAGRAGLERPPLDRAALTGWNGLAIGALARAGVLLDRPEWIDAARDSADALLAAHVLGDGRYLRMTVDGEPSGAVATLEDHGMLAGGLLRLAVATGEERWALTAREIVDGLLAAGDGGLAVPGGGDPVLSRLGLAAGADATDGAVPSGPSAAASAAELLWALTGERRYRDAARAATALRLAVAVGQPLGFGATLELAAQEAGDDDELVVVLPDGGADADALALVNRARRMPGTGLAIVTESGAARLASAGLALFEGRIAQGGRATAYRCRGLVCELPITDAAQLGAP